LIAGKTETGDLGRAVTAGAGESFALVIEHEQGPTLGIEIFGDTHQRSLERPVDVAGSGEILAHGRKKLQMVGKRIFGFPGMVLVNSRPSHGANMPGIAEPGKRITGEHAPTRK
jgi:hypothetical protein